MRHERLDLRPKRLDLRPEMQYLRPERPDLRPEGPDRRRTNKLMNGQTKESPPCVLQDFVPFEAAAQKSELRLRELCFCTLKNVNHSWTCRLFCGSSRGSG